MRASSPGSRYSEVFLVSTEPADFELIPAMAEKDEEGTVPGTDLQDSCFYADTGHRKEVLYTRLSHCAF